MPIDAPQAALIGAGAAAITSTVAAFVAARVGRRATYAQQLYAKRLELYEELWMAADQVEAGQVEGLFNSKNEMRVRLYSSATVYFLYVSARELLDRDSRFPQMRFDAAEPMIEMLRKELETDSRRTPTTASLRAVRRFLLAQRKVRKVVRSYEKLSTTAQIKRARWNENQQPPTS